MHTTRNKLHSKTEAIHYKQKRRSSEHYKTAKGSSHPGESHLRGSLQQPASSSTGSSSWLETRRPAANNARDLRARESNPTVLSCRTGAGISFQPCQGINSCLKAGDLFTSSLAPQVISGTGSSVKKDLLLLCLDQHLDSSSGLPYCRGSGSQEPN